MGQVKCYKCYANMHLKYPQQGPDEIIIIYKCDNCVIEVSRHVYKHDILCCSNISKGCTFKSTDELLLERHRQWFCKFADYECWMCLELTQEYCYICTHKYRDFHQCDKSSDSYLPAEQTHGVVMYNDNDWFRQYYGPYREKVYHEFCYFCTNFLCGCERYHGPFNEVEYCYFCSKIVCACEKYCGPYRDFRWIRQEDSFGRSYFDHISMHCIVANTKIINNNYNSTICTLYQANKWIQFVLNTFDTKFLVEYTIDALINVIIVKMISDKCEYPDNLVCNFKIIWKLPSGVEKCITDKLQQNNLNGFIWNAHIFPEELDISDYDEYVIEINIERLLVD